MSAPANNLYAVLLCTRTRTGAKIVFSASAATSTVATAPTQDVDQEIARENTGAVAPTLNEPAVQLVDDTVALSYATELDTTLGLKTDVLQKLLCPSRWADKQKFEVTIDGITFVGQPCFATDGERWLQAKPSIDAAQSAIQSSAEPEAHVPVVRDFTHAADSFDSRLSGQSLATSMESISTRSGTALEGLQMFHVVVATRQLQATAPLSSLHAGSLYENICQPLTRALQHLQEQSRYVELQCRKINVARTKSRPDVSVQDAIRHDSELAWALEELYCSIRAGDIATFNLQGMEMSLQIPQSTTSLPLPRSALNSALLLLEDRAKILRSLDARPETSALAYFITHLTPSKPLSKIATKVSLPVEAVLFLAEHLIRWRKARLIDPLHVRNYYVVNPGAPLDDLPRLCLEYSKKFPAIQSLSTMMSMLGSGAPTQYVSCIPSKVHRDTYMDILAWMVRHHLVTRLHTVAWLLVQTTPVADDASQDDETPDDSSSTISDSGTAFKHDELRVVAKTETTRLLDPAETSQRERSALIALRHSLGSEAELQDTFTRLVKYFDGESILEDVAILEGMKRSKVAACLEKLHELKSVQTYQFV